MEFKEARVARDYKRKQLQEIQEKRKLLHQKNVKNCKRSGTRIRLKGFKKSSLTLSLKNWHGVVTIDKIKYHRMKSPL
jgi:hypothetical protein